MAAEKKRRAFLSYSRVNKEFAIKLAKGLRGAGYPIWFDQFDIPTGSRWDDEVEGALRDCSIFMIILTPAAIASENVKDEIGYAIDHGKRILPVLLEDCDVPLRLRRFQYVDFTTKSFEEGFESAKDLLGDLIDEVSVPIGTTAPAVKPPEQKPAPVQRPASSASVEKAPSNKKGILIGGAIGLGVAIVLFIVVVSLLNSAAKKAASQAASAMLLSTTEAGNLMSIGAIPEYLDDVALSTYSESELKQFSDAGQPIPLTIDSQAPLLLGYSDCATTRAILDSNMASYINEVYSINGYIIPESSIGHYYYTETDGKSCAITYVVLGNWTAGTYLVHKSVELPKKINDGTQDIEPNKYFKEFNLTVSPSAEIPAGYVKIYNDTQSIKVVVPETWKDINPSGKSADGAYHFMAASENLAAYDKFAADGVIVFASSKVTLSVDAELDTYNDFLKNSPGKCEFSSEEDFSDSLYQGKKRIYACPGIEKDDWAFVYAVRPIKNPQSYIISVIIKIVSNDMTYAGEYMGQIENTFKVIGPLP